MAHPSDHESGPTITAKLDDGPMKGQRIETEIVQGRAPSTIDATADDSGTCWRTGSRAARRPPTRSSTACSEIRGG